MPIKQKRLPNFTSDLDQKCQLLKETECLNKAIQTN